MNTTLVETELNSSMVQILVVKAFCYNLSSKPIRILTDSDTNRYILAFEDGEDALNFKLKELDKALIKLLEQNAANKYTDLLTNHAPSVYPGTSATWTTTAQTVWGDNAHTANWVTSPTGYSIGCNGVNNHIANSGTTGPTTTV